MTPLDLYMLRGLDPIYGAMEKNTLSANVKPQQDGLIAVTDECGSGDSRRSVGVPVAQFISGGAILAQNGESRDLLATTGLLPSEVNANGGEVIAREETLSSEIRFSDVRKSASNLSREANVEQSRESALMVPSSRESNKNQPESIFNEDAEDF